MNNKLYHCLAHHFIDLMKSSAKPVKLSVFNAFGFRVRLNIELFAIFGVSLGAMRTTTISGKMTVNDQAQLAAN